MKQISERLTFANVMSIIAVFLVLGGTAFAAAKLGKNTVGTKQLKKNAVTKAKIKKGAISSDKLADGAVLEGKIGGGAVTEAKIKDGAVTGAKLGDNSVSTGKIQNGAINGEKVADGSLTGADINPGTTSFSQVVARLRLPGPVNLQVPGPQPLGSYTQAAGEDDLFLGGASVNFLATCEQPRSAAFYLLMDPVNPAAPSADNIVSLATVSDNSPGPITKRAEFPETPFGFPNTMKRIGGAAAQNHTFYVYLAGASCNAGSGITGSFSLDVIGTR